MAASHEKARYCDGYVAIPGSGEQGLALDDHQHPGDESEGSHHHVHAVEFQAEQGREPHDDEPDAREKNADAFQLNLRYGGKGGILSQHRGSAASQPTGGHYFNTGCAMVPRGGSHPASATVKCAWAGH